ncbi:MAG: flagellar type III secretion system pore protein FliP [Thermaerobacter sp.]|nr:flagellar biosynthetic protein FliP [Bacillota bacterium]
MLGRLAAAAAGAALAVLWDADPAWAQAVLPSLSLEWGAADGVEAWSTGLQILLLLTVLSLAPSILVMMTAFTRIVVVLAFVRYALSTQQLPPTQVLIALALFLTFFVMAPVWQQAYDEAWVPFREGEIDQATAVERAMEPVREFMFRHTRERDLALFVDYAGLERPETPDDVPSYLLIPAFAISELKTAFQIGFIVFVPFVVIDMIVASALMSMGMLMVPPMMVSLPFKVLLFVLVDGWHLVVESLLLGYGG